MTRTERLATLVRHLHDGTWMRAEDLAQTLGVSTRTVYRDVRALHAMGVPLRAAPGHGYTLPEGAALPPLALTRDEAALLLAGADHVASHVDARYRTAAQAAQQKIQALVTDDAGSQALRRALHTAPANVFDAPEARQTLGVLREAAETSRVLRAVVDGQTRAFHPYTLVRRSGAWWLVARDADAQRVATYRADRLLAPEVLAATFERPAAYARASDAETRDLEIRVRFSRVAARWLDAHPAPYLDALEHDDGGATATLRVQRLEEAMPYLLGWGAHACVVAPPAMQEMLRHEARRIARHYAPATPDLFAPVEPPRPRAER